MLSEKNLYPYQLHAVEHILNSHHCGLFLDLGLGKTISTLTAIVRLQERKEVKRVLIVAPLRVAESVWSDEIANWEHTKHLTLSRVTGSEKARKAALRVPADIYIVNRENVPWIVAQYSGAVFPFDMLVLDELSSFKSAKSARFKALRMVRPRVTRIVGLTGTPMPNSLLDLWPQLYLLDMGERLGKTITGYREKYFNAGKQKGHVVYDYKLKKGEDSLLGSDYYEKEIFDKIGDICISMKSADYLDLPPVLLNTVNVYLPAAAKTAYDDFERDQVLALEGAETITAVNAASLCGKLLQYAGGAIYDEDKAAHSVHTAKLDHLAERVEAAHGSPVLICYWFKHERDRILEALKGYKPRELKTGTDIADWNAGNIPVLLGHPMSMAHGLNLQHGGHRMIWFGPIWSLELFLQANKRLDRPGQKQRVFIDVMVAKDTMDEDAMKALAKKEKGQNALMDAVKARVAKWS